MKVGNERKAAFLFFVLLCGLVYVLGSCSGDNDFTGCDDLSLGMQIPMTRSADPESPFDINPRPDKIPVNEGECGLYALASLKQKEFNANNPASDYYNSIKQCAVDSMAYKPGEAMPANTMLNLGQRYGLLTGMTFFDEENHSEDYFGVSDNANNARIACFQKNGDSHYARIDKVDTDKGRVRYVDSDGAGWIDMSDLDGVMYYQEKKKDDKK